MKKVCSKCKEKKLYENFHKAKKSKDGYQSWCKECKNKLSITNRRKLSDYYCECGCGNKTFLASQTDKTKGWIKGKPLRYLKGHYKEGNKLTKQPIMRVIKNGKKICSGCHKKLPINRFTKNKQSPVELDYQCKECKKKKFRKTVKQNYEYHKWRWKLKRAKRKKAPGKTTAKQLKWRIEYFGFKCWICKKSYEEIDHVKPLSKGGTNWPANQRPICHDCNMKKSDKWFGVDLLNEFINK